METEHKHLLNQLQQQYIAILFIYLQLSLQNTQYFLPASPQSFPFFILLLFSAQTIWMTSFLQAIIFL